MTLPKPNQSRTESYLGAIVEQEGAVKPEAEVDELDDILEGDGEP